MENNSPIRILCVFARLDRGGAETMCMELYRHIDRRKVQFDFVKHGAHKGAFEDEIISLGGRIYEAPCYLGYNHLRYRTWWKNHLAKHQEHQVIHGHYFTLSPIYFSVCKKMGRITIGHAHSIKSAKAKNFRNKLRKIVQNIILTDLEQRTDHCFACSQEAGNWLFPNKKFIVLKNAIDVDKFAFSEKDRIVCRKELFIEKESMVIGTVGSITFPKNPHAVIDIFNEVHKKDPNTRLLWVGDGDMREEAEDHLQRKGLMDVAIMTGVRSDVERLLQAMDVFIFPSLYEGLGIGAIEAQASGLPCFCSEAVPLEVGITDLCSFLPLKQPEIWAERILNVKRRRKDISQQIRKAGYDIRETSKWLENFYCEISK